MGVEKLDDKQVRRSPNRDFSPKLKQDLSGLSGFFRQLRSKSCFKMSGLSYVSFFNGYLKLNEICVTSSFPYI